MTRLLTWVLPGGAVLAGTVAIVLGFGPQAFLAEVGVGYSWLVLGIVVALAAFFHRSRVVLATLGLIGLQWVYFEGVGGEVGFVFSGGLWSLLVGFLVIFQDRGMFSSPGILQFGSFVVALGLGWLFLLVAPGDIESVLAFSPFPASFTAWSGIPQPTFIAFGFATASAVIVAMIREGPVERGIFWSILLVALSQFLSSDPGLVGVCLLASAITMGLSVMETTYAMAYKDDLTGLPARRALMRDLQGVGGTYSAAMVDVDHFKKFNDRYGHDVGDQVLRMVASRLAKAPGGGRAYRFGGEEFTLLYPGKTLQEVLPHLKEVRRSVEEAAFTLRSWRRPRKKPVDPGAWRGSGKRQPKRLSVTVSIGVGDSTGSDSSPEVVLKKADQALYRAKKSGRNRVAK